MDEKKAVEFATSMEALMPIFQEQLASGKSIRFAPRGTSMLPMLRQGIDTVVLAPLPQKLKVFDVVLYRRANGRYVLHRIVKVGQAYTCIGDHQFIYEPGIRPEQMIAWVSGFYRKDRYWSSNDFLYHLYCWLLHLSRPLRGLWYRGLGWLRRNISRR